MRCTQCGSILPPGVAQCPVCGARTDGAQAREGNRPQYWTPGDPQGAPGGGEYGFSANDSKNLQNRYATPAFHTYRKQMLTGFPENQQADYQGHSRDSFNPGGAFVRALSDLPQVFRSAFDNPTGALQGMMRRGDRFTGGILVLLSLVFAFLAGMILTKAALGTLFSVLSGLTSQQMADSAASLNQGVGYLAGKVAVSVGGIAALCQLIAALIPAAVTMAYLSLLRQVRFSFLLLSGFTAVITLPNLIALLLASVFSLITPYLSLIALFFGQVVSYVLLCTMAVQIAELDSTRAVPAQASLVCLSELTKIILIAVAGGALMGGVIRTLAGLTSSVGGLL
jgi:hypothetical protein